MHGDAEEGVMAPEVALCSDIVDVSLMKFVF